MPPLEESTNDLKLCPAPACGERIGSSATMCDRHIEQYIEHARIADPIERDAVRSKFRGELVTERIPVGRSEPEVPQASARGEGELQPPLTSSRGQGRDPIGALPSTEPSEIEPSRTPYNNSPPPEHMTASNLVAAGCLGVFFFALMSPVLFVYKCHNDAQLATSEKGRHVPSPAEIVAQAAGPGFATELTASKGFADVKLTAMALTSEDAFLYKCMEIIPPTLAAVPEAKKVRIAMHANMIDTYGNEKVEFIASLHFSRDEANRVDWKNIGKDNFRKLASSYWIHSAYRR